MTKSFRRSLWFGVTIVGISLLIILSRYLGQSSLFLAIEDLSFALGDTYNQWFQQQAVGHPFVLMGLSFLGGLVASISPCILSLLPVNLSYIGTCNITSRRDALLKASAFVLGVVTVLSLLGLSSSLASIVLVGYKGYVHLVVGAIIVTMALSLAGVIQLPLPQSWMKGLSFGQRSGVWHDRLTTPFCVGLTFALISSPCTSPIMVAVLATAAASGSPVHSGLAMVCYALGYTAVIFFASLFTGLVKQSRGLLVRSEGIMRAASFSLLLVGGFYLVTGCQWIWAVWSHA
jgi:cytochrome c-type biogenesis protein